MSACVVARSDDDNDGIECRSSCLLATMDGGLLFEMSKLLFQPRTENDATLTSQCRSTQDKEEVLVVSMMMVMATLMPLVLALENEWRAKVA